MECSRRSPGLGSNRALGVQRKLQDDLVGISAAALRQDPLTTGSVLSSHRRARCER